MPVEIQFRTIAMDFWASIEHKLKYKKNMDKSISEEISESLRICAEEIQEMDMRMQSINRRIEESNGSGKKRGEKNVY